MFLFSFIYFALGKEAGHRNISKKKKKDTDTYKRIKRMETHVAQCMP